MIKLQIFIFDIAIYWRGNIDSNHRNVTLPIAFNF